MANIANIFRALLLSLHNSVMIVPNYDTAVCHDGMRSCQNGTSHFFWNFFLLLYSSNMAANDAAKRESVLKQLKEEKSRQDGLIAKIENLIESYKTIQDGIDGFGRQQDGILFEIWSCVGVLDSKKWTFPKICTDLGIKTRTAYRRIQELRDAAKDSGMSVETFINADVEKIEAALKEVKLRKKEQAKALKVLQSDAIGVEMDKEIEKREKRKEEANVCETM